MKMTKTIKDASTSSSTQLGARAEAYLRKHGQETHPTRTSRFIRIISRIILTVVASLSLYSLASAATFTVTNTNHSGPGSLRQAIVDVNSSSNPDFIEFNIPLSDPNCNATTRVCTIIVLSDLPTINGPARIDGYTQPWASENTLALGTNAALKIEIKGTRGAPFPVQGLRGFNGVVFHGLIVNNFDTPGITMEGGGGVGGCFIGTDATGTIAVPNGNNGNPGIAAAGDFITIGSAALGDRNLISGNLAHGIAFSNGGGSDASTSHGLIINNLIGVKADGVSPLGNGGDGIRLRDTTSARINDHLISNNVIAFNGGIGVNIAHGGVGTRNAPLRDRIPANSIYSNGNLGINLGDFQGGVNPNDSCDGDGGIVPHNDVNFLQNYPVITSAVTSGGDYLIDGFLNSNPGGTYTIQFFASDSCDASGYGEGKTFLGETAITDSDFDCVSTFSASFPIPTGVGLIITTTATDSAGNTSEFSSCAPAGPGCLPMDSLVSQYHGENSGYDGQDRNHGTPLNGVSSGEMNFGDGLLGRAFKLDGGNDFVRIPHSSSLNFTNFTLETWVKTDQAAGTFGMIWSKNSTFNGYNDPFTLMITSDGRAAGRVGKGDNATEVGVGSSVAVNDNNWHHLALTFDGVHLRLYRDGNLDDSQLVSFPLYNNTQDAIIGQWAAGVPNPLHNYRGLIDELSVHNRALSNSEIAAIHRGGTTGQCQPLIIDGDGDGIADDDDNCPAVANGDQLNTDGDEQGDACDADDDNDGYSDEVETTEGSDPRNDDSTPEVCDGLDNDLNDGVDENFPNTDGDSEANCVDADDDNDTFSDLAEITAGSDPVNADSTPEVCDGVDNDLNDGADEGFPNTDGDGQANCVDSDDDNDGQSDTDEIACGSNPLDAQSKATDMDVDNRPDCVDPDDDGDGIHDNVDNCPFTSNDGQIDTDSDGQGDACDLDDDNDGVHDGSDQCPGTPSGTQVNAAGCPDADGDGVADTVDNCPNDPNSNQANFDNDAQGDACDGDDDNDGFSDAVETNAGSDPLNASSTPEVCDGVDNDLNEGIDEGFPNTDGDSQANCVDADDDGDGYSDAFETTTGSDPLNANSTPEVCDGVDNDLNEGIDEGFPNTDGDAQANCVDSDDDNDSFTDAVETAAGSDPLNANSTPEVCDGIDNDLNEGIDERFPNADGDSQANCVDADDDNDGQTDADEIACGSDPLNSVSKSLDTDGDNRPNCVDTDDDNDGVNDTTDNCPLTPNPSQSDTDHDGIGDACDTAVLYNICTLYDQDKAHKSGSAVPIKLRLCDAGGQNLSSPAIVVTAIGIRKISDSAYGPVEDSGHANPDYNFRYDGTLGGPGGGYIFNLSTKGLGTGTYLLGFVAGSDPTVYTVQFKVK